VSVWRRLRDAWRRSVKRRDEADADEFAREHEFGDVPNPNPTTPIRDGGKRSPGSGGFPTGGAGPV
jgi:hypothetical protein